MIDKKVYRNDYESEFTAFFKEVPATNPSDSVAVDAEVNTYTLLNELRDVVKDASSRNKLWEGF